MAPRVPQRKCENSIETRQKRFTLIFVKMHKHFGVARRAKAMSARFEIAAQFAMIVDFAVEDNPNRAVLVCHWLIAGREINDAEARVPQNHARILMDARTVGTAMRERVAHRFDDCAIRLLAYHSTDAAHRNFRLTN